jgi:hypothetical protein
MKIQFVDHWNTWTHWFAWHPVWIDHNTMVWWETVERKLRMYGYDPVWEYRLPEVPYPFEEMDRIQRRYLIFMAVCGLIVVACFVGQGFV